MRLAAVAECLRPTLPADAQAGVEVAVGPVRGADGVARCPWAVDEPERSYHDTEWGVEVRGERRLFERLSLEAFQSGLSWRVILDKRAGFRRAFADFDPEVVADFGDDDVASLLHDPGIVRSRAKIRATIANARATLVLRNDGGLDPFLWSYRPDATEAPRTVRELPTRSDTSAAMARALKQRGFSFVGPTTMHALMEAVGMVDNHLVGCHRRGVART